MNQLNEKNNPKNYLVRKKSVFQFLGCGKLLYHKGQKGEQEEYSLNY